MNVNVTDTRFLYECFKYLFLHCYGGAWNECYNQLYQRTIWQKSPYVFLKSWPKCLTVALYYSNVFQCLHTVFSYAPVVSKVPLLIWMQAYWIRARSYELILITSVKISNYSHILRCFCVRNFSIYNSNHNNSP